MQWDAAYVDELPDSAFLWIEAGGALDAERRTMPRSLRHFPVRDKTGKVDADHLRNALNRIPGSDLPPKAKASATAHGQHLLEQAARTYGGAGSSVHRVDAGTLGAAQRTGSGGIRLPAYVSRVGVLPYLQADGTILRELRPPEEVFAEDALASYASACVTHLHPVDADGAPVQVDAANWRTYSIGHVETGARREGEMLAAPIVIQDANAIAAVDGGEIRECSSGYTCRLEMRSGMWGDEPYDAIQRDIRQNHLALGPTGWGRAGPDVRLRLNSRERAMPNAKQTIDGVEYEIGSDSHAQALEKRDRTFRERMDALEAANKKAASELAAEKQARADDAKAAKEALASRARLLELHGRAMRHVGRRTDDAAAAAMDPAALLEEIGKAVGLPITVAGMSAEQVALEVFRARLAQLVEAAGVEPPEPIEEPPMDETGDPMDPAVGSPPPPAPRALGKTIEEAARDRMIDRNRRAWQGSKPSDTEN